MIFAIHNNMAAAGFAVRWSSDDSPPVGWGQDEG